MSSILVGDTMVPNIETWSKIISSFWGFVSYMRNIILLGTTIKKSATQMQVGVSQQNPSKILNGAST